jgi:hypothetical protein
MTILAIAHHLPSAFFMGPSRNASHFGSKRLHVVLLRRAAFCALPSKIHPGLRCGAQRSEGKASPMGG